MKLAWTQVRQILRVLVRGIINPDGTINTALENACRDGFKRSFFFAPALEELSGLGASLKGAGDHLRPGKVVPTAPLTAMAAAGRQAASLYGIVSIIQTVEAALKHGRHSNDHAQLVEALSESGTFSHPHVLAPGSIIPAIRAPEPQALRGLRKQIAPGLHRNEFSRRLMEGALHNRRAESEFLGHLEDGYFLPGKADKALLERRAIPQEPGQPDERDPIAEGLAGQNKLTDTTAQLLHGRLSAQCIAAGIEIPSFEEFAPVDALAGPRKGQVSRGLRVPDGNLMP